MQIANLYRVATKNNCYHLSVSPRKSLIREQRRRKEITVALHTLQRHIRRQVIGLEGASGNLFPT